VRLAGVARRYGLPIVVIVLNNSGIYGGDRRPPALQEAAAAGASAGGFAKDPVPTAFVPDARCAWLACTVTRCALRTLHPALELAALPLATLAVSTSSLRTASVAETCGPTPRTACMHRRSL
jgi:hypothetical protein